MRLGTTVRYHSTRVRMRRNRNPYALPVGMWNDAATTENSLAVPQKLNIQSSYDPAIPLLDIYPEELKTGTQTHVQACPLQDYSQQPEDGNNSNVRQQMKGSTNSEYTCSGILLGPKKKHWYILQCGRFATTFSWEKGARYRRSPIVWFHLNKISRMHKSRATGSKLMAVGGREGNVA